jgi:hypothetical protein
MGNIALLERTLVSVLAHRPTDCEILVVLNGEYADPYNLEGEVGFVEARFGASLVECLNVGIAATSAPFVHTLPAGAEVEDDWTLAALRRFAEPRVAAVAPLALDSANATRFVGVSCLRGGQRVDLGCGQPIHTVAPTTSIVAPHLFTGFYRAQALAQLGKPFSSYVGHLADLDLGLRLKQVGLEAVFEPGSRVIVHDDVTIIEPTEFQAGRQAERLYWRNAPALGWIRGSLAHLASVGIEIAGCFRAPRRAKSLLGRLTALGEYPGYVRHWQEMAIVRELVSQALEDTRADSDESATEFRSAA